MGEEKEQHRSVRKVTESSLLWCKLFAVYIMRADIFRAGKVLSRNFNRVQAAVHLC